MGGDGEDGGWSKMEMRSDDDRGGSTWSGMKTRMGGEQVLTRIYIAWIDDHVGFRVNCRNHGSVS